MLDIKNDPFIKIIFVTKAPAYANDITCYNENRSLERLIDRAKFYCGATQPSINVDKTEFLIGKSIQYNETQIEKSKQSELNMN